MSAMRCSICAIRYPTNMTECPVCESKLWRDIMSTVSENWQWEATVLIQKRDEEKEVDLQPFFMLIEIKSDPNGGQYIDRYEAYRMRGNRIMHPGDVLEIPAKDDPGETHLWEVHWNDRTFGRYYLREMRTIPGPTNQDGLILYDPIYWES